MSRVKHQYHEEICANSPEAMTEARYMDTIETLYSSTERTAYLLGRADRLLDTIANETTECPLCGKALDGERVVHQACSDEENARLDFSEPPPF